MPPNNGRVAYMQVSVFLPPALVDGLVDNYKAVTGKRAGFSTVAEYAISELYADIADLKELTAAGITLPDFDPAYRIDLPKSMRRAAHGFYSMKVPDHLRDVWWSLLKQHDLNGPATLYRAMLSLYRVVYDYYAENDPASPWFTKYPRL